MKSLKRTMAMCAALAIVMSYGNYIGTYAADEAKIVVTTDKTEYNPGDIVTVTVSTENNPGLNAWSLIIEYDNDVFVLSPDDDENYSEFYVYASDFADASNADVMEPGNSESPLDSFLWYESTKGSDRKGAPYTIDGTMVQFTLKVKDKPASGNYTISVGSYSANANTYDEVDEKGRPLTSGPVTFTTVPATVSVTAPEVAPTGLTVDKTSISFTEVGKTEKITATVTPDEATNKNVKFTSSNTSVATVAADGTVTSVGEGNATITVEAEADSSLKKTVSVSVAHTHTLTPVAEVPATCTAEGVKEHYKCSGCDKLFSDASGAVEVTAADLKIAKTAHNFVENPSAEYLKSEATCTKKAVYYKSCSVCGEKSTETFEYGAVDPDNHVGTTSVQNQKDASCQEEGYTGDIVCDDCGEIITPGTKIDKLPHTPADSYSHDADSHWKECTVCGEKLDVEAHKGGEATCSKKAVCSVCGEEYGELDPTNHKNVTLVGAVDPTYDAPGYTGDKKCLDCGTVIETGTEIPMLVHGFEYVAAKDADCETDGNIAYYVRDDGKLFTDTDATTELTAADVVIPKSGHDFGEITGYTWSDDYSKCTATRVCSRCNKEETLTVDTTYEDTVPATCEAGGKRVYTATFNKDGFVGTDTKTGDTEALNHKWGDWEVVKEATYEEEGLRRRVCENDPTHIEEEPIPVLVHTYEKVDAKDPTCEEDGNIAYYVRDDGKFFDGDTDGANELTEDDIKIPATDHTFGAPTYTWNDDNTEVTATRVCESDASHVETETAKVTKSVTKPATCTETGEEVLTAEFENAAFETQTKTNELEKLDHEWGEWTVTKEATTEEEGERTRTCAVCGETETEVIDKLTDEGGDSEGGDSEGGDSEGGNTEGGDSEGGETDGGNGSGESGEGGGTQGEGGNGNADGSGSGDGNVNPGQEQPGNPKTGAAASAMAALSAAALGVFVAFKKRK